MTRWLLVLVLVGCGRLGFEPAGEVKCASGETCPDDVTCKPTSGSCEDPGGGVVGGDAGLDAAIDAPGATGGGNDASFCLGDAMVMACLSRPPAAALTINSPSTVDTDQPVFCSTDAVGASASYCIVTGTAITITAGQTLSAHGSRPLVLMSSGAITVMGTIDVAGHVLGLPQATGPGVPATGPGSSCTPAIATTGAAGGSGGSFGSAGGGGGADPGGHPGGVASAAVAPTALRGGCPGEAGLNSGGAAGGGGGAIALLAGTQIQIDGAVNASGGGGGGSMLGPNLGGGGGGTGGMIVIDAPTVTGASTAMIFANGGSGGGGAQGQNGSDAPTDPTIAAVGGAGSGSAGDGGKGAIGAAQAGQGAGAGRAGGTMAGGGGGGGGVGVIKVYKAGALPGTVSPPAS